jgi:hypothetical protein
MLPADNELRSVGMAACRLSNPQRSLIPSPTTGDPPRNGWSFRLIVDPPKSWRRSCFWRSVIEPGKAPALAVQPARLDLYMLYAA